MAAIFVAAAEKFACAAVRLELRRDRTVFFPFNRMQSLLIEPLDAGTAAAHPARCTATAFGPTHQPAR